MTTTSGGARLRRGLVLFQFALSMMLIVGAATVYDQLDFMRSSTLRFDDEQILVVPLLDRSLRPQVEALKRELLRQPDVVTVSASHRVPGQLFNGFSYVPEGGDPENPVGVRDVGVDHEFTKTFGLDLAAGRDWSREIVTDEDEAFLINETAARVFGWADPGEAVGKRLTRNEREGVVIGVVKDFHFQSLHHTIEPLLMHLRPFAMNVSVRVRTDDLPATVAALERTWQQFSPTFPFDYYFLDEAFDSRYRAEERAGQLFGYFALLAVFIACLGLFGLAAFSAAQRTKEIGVRKVLGASVGGIVVLLSKDFVKLVGWAFVVATPLAYLAMSRWLDNFPYHVEISWRIFLVAGLSALVVAVLTVSYQSIRAALTNPVEALRYE
ncbi:MAG: ABC transporter permease [Bacteroidetes bacterium]|nr:ABC transporter permease [Bacteroidota bacterium]